MSKRLFLLLALMFSMCAAQAYTYIGPNNPSASTTWQGACVMYLARVVPTWSYDHMEGLNSDASRWCDAKNASGSVVRADIMSRVGTACASPNVEDPTTGECKAPTPPPCSDTAKWIVRVNYSGSGPYAPPTNWSGCKVGSQEMQVCRADGTGGSYCLWQVQRTGDPTSDPISTPTSPTVTQGSDTTPTDKPVVSPKFTPAPDSPSKCPAGSVEAGIDSSGIPICMGTGTQPKPAPTNPTKTTSPTITKTNADGSTTTTTTTSTKNADGSSSTVTDTTNTGTDGTVTKSQAATTSLTPTGAAGRADDPKDLDDLCKRNPLLSMCRTSSVNGTCGAITCDGDAIQCATLRAAAAMQCQQKADLDSLTNPQTTLGQQILSGADPQDVANAANLRGTSVDLSNPHLDSTGFLGGGSCLANRSFTVMGQTVVMDFTTVCDKITPLRYVVMACASVIAYLIIAKSVLQG